jgi:Xaa-Pro aminopeptidase
VSAQRRERLRGLLAEQELDALLVTSLINVRYLTGFTGTYGQLLVTTDGGGDVFVTDGRYAEQAAEQVPHLEVLLVPGAGWLRGALGSRGALALEAHLVPWATATRTVQNVDAHVMASHGLVEQLRQVKDDAEVAALRRACAIADEAFAQLLTWLGPGMVEREAAVRLERAMVDAGAEDRSFPTIVASGPNSAIPHHRAGDRVLRSGDLVKFDFGALVDGYHSDMTRMVALGDPGAQLREVFGAVRAAQEAGLAASRAGAGTGDVDAACRAVLDAADLGERFVHGTGHGIGLEIHEDPYLRPETPRAGLTASRSVTLRAGMAVTVEPGVYLPGVGGVRIEDSLIITPSGPDVLTLTPKDLVVL